VSESSPGRERVSTPVYRARMALTPLQELTLADLMASGLDRPRFDPDLARELRDDLESRLGPALSGRGPPLWVTKARLVDIHQRCEGLFLANVLDEAPFSYSRQLAEGRLVHKAVEIAVYSDIGEVELVERAVGRIREREPEFGRYLDLLGEVERAEIAGEAVRQLAWFRSVFPPLERSWNPVVEWGVRAELLGGRVILSARPDLVLGGVDRADPFRARRLVLELKGGQERPEQDDDVRFYALVLALRHGVPPFRVATVNLQSGTWRAQDVTPDLLASAARRVADGCLRAAALLGGTDPALRGGAWCTWCPRSPTCPSSTARGSG
jgi:PD-(D/E)XK nuclease superfamily